MHNPSAYSLSIQPNGEITQVKNVTSMFLRRFPGISPIASHLSVLNFCLSLRLVVSHKGKAACISPKANFYASELEWREKY